MQFEFSNRLLDYWSKLIIISFPFLPNFPFVLFHLVFFSFSSMISLTFPFCFSKGSVFLVFPIIYFPPPHFPFSTGLGWTNEWASECMKACMNDEWMHKWKQCMPGAAVWPAKSGWGIPETYLPSSYRRLARVEENNCLVVTRRRWGGGLGWTSFATWAVSSGTLSRTL